MGRNKNYADIRVGGFNAIPDNGENGSATLNAPSATSSRRGPTYNLTASFKHLQGVETASSSSYALDHYPRVSINQDAHCSSPRCQATAAFTSAAVVLKKVRFSLLKRDSSPESPFVPSRRIKIGFLGWLASSVCRMP